MWLRTAWTHLCDGLPRVLLQALHRIVRLGGEEASSGRPLRIHHVAFDPGRGEVVYASVSLVFLRPGPTARRVVYGVPAVKIREIVVYTTSTLPKSTAMWCIRGGLPT